MSVAPQRSQARQLARNFTASERLRRPPSPGGIARRRIFIRFTKFLLPLAAVALLGAIALWPEIERATDHGRMQYGQLSAELDGAKLTDARYRGVDEQGRPYTVTAKTAKQVTADRVNLTTPVGDVTMHDGSWLQISAKDGVYLKQAQSLDLSHDVVLYRDDGTTMKTEAASVDLQRGAAASNQQTHAEGPFGTLDASGFTLLDSGAGVQFSGPAHLVLNAAGG